MLVFESAEQLLAEPEPRRYLHVIVLNALQDRATRLEIRFMEDGGLLYYRVAGRDWELSPPPDEVYPLLKETIRAAARLVAPARPETTILYGVPGARYEPIEAGWLTYQIEGRWIDLLVRIDPREPFGSVRFDIDPAEAEGFAEPAANALAAYAAYLVPSDLPE